MLLAIAAALVSSAAPDTLTLSAGMVITRSAVLRSAGEVLRPLPGDSIVVRVRGSGIVLDFRGAALTGALPGTPPDQRSGYGLVVEGGRDVTIRGAVIRGFKVGLLARGVTGLVVEGTDLSDNWAPRLWSGLGHESLVDWLSYHRNEGDEWLRYGAGLYLADVHGGTIRGNIATGGQNGLLLVRSSDLRIYNNTFSWLSGLGIGLYRSRHNTIMHNRLDWCVRGHVPGVYNRGQDSAALLLYEQSSDNVVAYNSMTHSGDGVFLWAGQSTMESGLGGSNDNLFFGNDASFAVTNGVELTFSRNRLIGNRIDGGQYGLWGGYSYQSEIRGNRFRGNVVGIAIEHGQDNRILANRFGGDGTAIRLWANPSEPADWGYPRRRDTRSRNVDIAGNVFDSNRVALRIDRTDGVRLAGNRYEGVDTLLVSAVAGGRLEAVTGKSAGSPPPPGPWRPDLRDPAAPRPLPDGMAAWRDSSLPEGRAAIRVGEWGPYDGRHPVLWPARLADSVWTGGPLVLTVLGPAGQWRVTHSRGVDAVLPREGRVGDTVTVVPAPGPVVDLDLELEYVGQAVRAPGPVTAAAGAPYRFRFRRFTAPIDWTIRAFAWDSLIDPRRGPDAIEGIRSRPPVGVFETAGLDWMWYRPRIAGIPAERFFVEAEGTVDLPEGEYEIIAISDDGIRLWVDDDLVIDRWEAHESVVDRARLGGGRHRFRADYYQVDGWVELRVEVRKR